MNSLALKTTAWGILSIAFLAYLPLAKAESLSTILVFHDDDDANDGSSPTRKMMMERRILDDTVEIDVPFGRGNGNCLLCFDTNFECSNDAFGGWMEGKRHFQDPLPTGACLQELDLVVFGACDNGNPVQVHLNGQSKGVTDSGFNSCACGSCPSTTFSTVNVDNYIMGETNELQLTETGDHYICIYEVILTFTYDVDTDGDGICDVEDDCPNDPYNDTDGDGICGDLDPCPYDPENDADGDGFCADVDECPDTELMAFVDDHGCSIDQHCECNSFRSHGEYMKCINDTADWFVMEGFLAEEEKRELILERSKNNCSKSSKGGTFDEEP